MSAREDIDASVRESRGCAFRAYKTGTQSISNTTATTLAWDAESYDVGSDFDLANDKFVAPVTGYYAFDLSYRYTGSGDMPDGTYVLSYLAINGGSVLLRRDFMLGAAGQPCVGLSIASLKLTAGQEVIARTYHNGGGSFLVDSDSTENWFSGTLLHT